MKLKESAENFWKHLQVTSALFPNTHANSKMMMRTPLFDCNMQMRYIEDNISKTFGIMNVIIGKGVAHHTKKNFLKSHIVWWNFHFIQQIIQKDLFLDLTQILSWLNLFPKNPMLKKQQSITRHRYVNEIMDFICVFQLVNSLCSYLICRIVVTSRKLLTLKEGIKIGK